ncbi:MAG: YihY/virulence factor BrkB family protein [Rickettsiales bacterium]
MIKNNGIEFSGYLSYLSILSIFPFTFILISTVSILDNTESGARFIKDFFSIMPTYLLDILKPQIDNLLSGPPSNLFSIAFIGAIWTASSFVESLKQIFNNIYKIEDQPSFILSRAFSIIQFILAILAILLTMTAFIILPKIFKFFELNYGIKVPYLGNEFMRFFFFSVIMIWIISSVFYSLTHKKISFLSTIPGAFVSLIIWYISAEVLSYYVNNFHQINATYGSIASIIIVLFFFYVVNFSLLYGAEINYLLLKHKYRALSLTKPIKP